MQSLLRYRYYLIITFSIVLGIMLFERCNSNTLVTNSTDSKAGFDAFAGSASCASCHQEIAATHQSTAHHLTSALANGNNILGSFESGKNIFPFSAGAIVAMEKRKDSFYQVHYADGIQRMARKFDIVIGSGTKGQTFLNWYNERLMQLPITYFTPTNQWCNSPGYPGKVVFNRSITSRCIECHTTYADVTSVLGKEPESFNKQHMIYGVDCEKCHGPAAAHVSYQSKHPEEKQAKFVVNPAGLSRQQNLDLCILCHGGRLQKTKPSFSFTVGNRLTDYFTSDTTNQLVSEIDVHGNQYGLLAASKCFTKSNSMTCNSCHNAHVKDAGQLTLYSQKCITCHTTEHVQECSMKGTVGAALTANCIDCHMPMEQSKAIVVMLPGSDVAMPAQMRSHYIKGYADATRKYMEQLKMSSGKK